MFLTNEREGELFLKLIENSGISHFHGSMCVFIDGGSPDALSGGVSVNFPVSIQQV
jgi:hypothetical protein